MTWTLFTSKYFTMAKVGKKRAAAEAKVDRSKSYTLDEAAALVKEVNTTKFDASGSGAR